MTYENEKKKKQLGYNPKTIEQSDLMKIHERKGSRNLM